MNTSRQTGKRHDRQQGAALVIGLLLLVVITTLAVSGMNTATTELAMARNDQNYEFAFQAAETGLEQAMAVGRWDPDNVMDLGVSYINSHDVVHATIRPEEPTIVPDKAFSLGSGSSIQAWHFVAAAQASSKRAPGSTTDRDSTALHTQAFYIVGPANNQL